MAILSPRGLEPPPTPQVVLEVRNYQIIFKKSGKETSCYQISTDSNCPIQSIDGNTLSD